MLSTAQKVQPGATERSWPGGRRLLRQLVQDRAHLVVGHGVPEVGAVDGEAVERALLVDRRGQELRDAPARGRPGADHVVLQADQLAVGIEPGLHLLVGERPGEIHRHVVFAGIDQLDGLADRLRRQHRGDHHVGVEPAAEAAAHEVLVQHHVLRDRCPAPPRRCRRCGWRTGCRCGRATPRPARRPWRSSARAGSGC